MRSLHVHLGDRRVGELTLKDNGNMRFRYESDYEGAPVSFAMPVNGETHSHALCVAVFGGLLPEGLERDTLARRLGISVGNDFGLLEAIGGDCAGAMTLLTPQTEQATEAIYDRFDRAGLDSLIESLPQRPLGVDPESGVRLSLAGAQSKVPVAIDADGFGLPASPAAVSTHIIKPQPQRFDGLVDNESFCLDLAAACGLPAASARKATTASGIDYLVVERFDRDFDVDPPVRIHQEDVCQSLGVPSHSKYQQDGGPGVAAVSDLILSACAVPTIDLNQFWRGLAFSWLIGNCDAHAKNYSLLHFAGGTELAPFYDLVCTRMYPELSSRFAMRIGAATDVEQIDIAAWRDAAKSSGLDAGLGERAAREMAERVLREAPEVANRPEHQNPAAEFIANAACSRATNPAIWRR